ncbi:MAG: TolC family protein, partial [Victivallales bacterium]|nr:TolC family protein [Victivallales bacterium]
QCKLINRQVELYRDTWENGEIDILELVRTQTDLENSYVDLSDSKINYLELLANYMFLIGK